MESSMSRRLMLFSAVAAWIVLFATAFPDDEMRIVAAAQQQPSADRRIWEGVYTVAQADRGWTRFHAGCIR